MALRLLPLRIVAVCSLVLLSLAAPAAAQSPTPTPTPSGFSPSWVVVLAPTEQWSGSEPGAGSFGPVADGTPLRVVAPQQGGRLLVYNPLTDNVAWVEAAAVAPIPPPSEEELAALLAPPSPPFEPYWAMTHRPAIAWSADSEDAVAWVRIPQWRYLRVVQPEELGRVLTVDPRTEGYGYVDLEALGPVGPPPPRYFDDAPADDETLALPGRIVGTVDRFEQPDNADFFSLDPLFHNDSVTVQGVVDRAQNGRWYRIGGSAYVPDHGVRLPSLPERTFPGRWVDADLSEPAMVTAYEGETPVYTALAVKGRIASQTPAGVFRIFRRVDNEIMNSETLSPPISRYAPGGYYLRNVLFTQYFTSDGAALHYNYWRSDWGYAGSQGCLGMNFQDSKFFWDFAGLGTIVYVHE